MEAFEVSSTDIELLQNQFENILSFQKIALILYFLALMVAFIQAQGGMPPGG